MLRRCLACEAGGLECSEAEHVLVIGQCEMREAETGRSGVSRPLSLVYLANSDLMTGSVIMTSQANGGRCPSKTLEAAFALAHACACTHTCTAPIQTFIHNPHKHKFNQEKKN